MPKRKTAAKAPKVAEEYSDSAADRIIEETIRNGSPDAKTTLKWLDVECPHCGEDFEVCVDPSEEGHEMFQDCQVCCRAVQLSVEMEDEEVVVLAYRS